jgi:hypothetical protein
MFAGRSIAEIAIVALLSLAAALASAVLSFALVILVSPVLRLGDLGILLMFTVPEAVAIAMFILTFKGLLTITK